MQVPELCCRVVLREYPAAKTLKARIGNIVISAKHDWKTAADEPTLEYGDS